MKSFVLDASAVLRFIDDGPGASRIEELIIQAQDGRVRIVISAVNWGEVYYVIARKRGDSEANTFSGKFRNLPIKIIPADDRTAELAGELRNRFALPYADAFAASLAESEHATLVTGNFDFKTLKDVLPVEFLPQLRGR